MDIDDFEVSKDPVPLTIKHPNTGKDTDIVLQILSPDSPLFKRLTIEEARKNVKPDGKVDIERIAQRGVEMASSVITGWEGIKVKGKAFKYSKSNAVTLLTDFPWIGDQVERFIKDRANFFVGSPKA